MDFEWTQFFQFLIIGLATGSLVALIALGYTLVYGIIELINFAHGEVFMMGAFFAATLVTISGIDNESSGFLIVAMLVITLLASMLFAGGAQCRQLTGCVIASCGTRPSWRR